jgi:hypothetical protein
VPNPSTPAQKKTAKSPKAKRIGRWSEHIEESIDRADSLGRWGQYRKDAGKECGRSQVDDAWAQYREDAAKRSPKDRGLVKQEITNKHGEQQTVWKKPVPQQNPHQRRQSIVSAADFNRIQPAKIEGLGAAATFNETQGVSLDGKNYVLKTTKLSSFSTAAHEMVVADLGRLVGVPVNRVRLVPTTALNRPDRAATLHEVVPGISAKQAPIAQQVDTFGLGLKVDKYTPKSSALQRISRALQHPDLARISALDLFVGQTDRNLGNLIYDPKTDRYTAIDNEHAYDPAPQPMPLYEAGQDAPNQVPSLSLKEILAGVSNHPVGLPSERMAQAFTAADDAELDRAFAGQDLEPFVSTLEKLHTHSPRRIAQQRHRYLMVAKGQAFPSGENTTIERTWNASHQVLKRLQDYQARQRVGEPLRTDAKVEKKEPDLADHIADRLLSEAAEPVRGWLDHIRGWMQAQAEEGQPLETVRDRMAELYEQLDPGQFSQLLGNGLMLSQLAGRDEVMQEIEEDERQDSLRADDRRIWVDDPSVENNGYYRRIKDRKTPAIVSPFVSQKEFSQFRQVKDVRHKSGVNTSFFVESPNGDRKVFKQALRSEAISVASEVLASEIGLQAGIKVNRSRLIPAAARSEFKAAGNVATLHDLVPGRAVIDLKRSKWADTDIQMSSWASYNFDALLNATQHQDLAKLLAFDTFVANSDRHSGNLFYDPRKGFHGIDLGYSFGEPVAIKMAEVLENTSDTTLEMLAEDDHARTNLTHYVTTLETLRQQNSADSLRSRRLRYTAAALGNPRFETEFQQHVQMQQLQPDEPLKYASMNVELVNHEFETLRQNQAAIPRIINRLKPYTQQP